MKVFVYNFPKSFQAKLKLKLKLSINTVENIDVVEQILLTTFTTNYIEIIGLI